MNPIVMIKLGGSLITDKGRPNTARPETMIRLAEELQAVAAQNSNMDFILAHGSGSFGHVAASAAGLRSAGPIDANPPGISASQRLGSVQVQIAARELHLQLLGALAAASAPAWSWPAAQELAWSDDVGMVLDHPESTLPRVEAHLRAGFIPTCFGDVVHLQGHPPAIASTESILLALGRALRTLGRSVRMIWLGVTDGVLNEAGHTIPRLDQRSWKDHQLAIRGAEHTDVTGGMMLRVGTTLAAAQLGISSIIANGEDPGILSRVVANVDVPNATSVPAEGLKSGESDS